MLLLFMPGEPTEFVSLDVVGEFLAFLGDDLFAFWVRFLLRDDKACKRGDNNYDITK